jgi:ATP-dependent Clp protease ATP-binding subunit ClpC
MDAANMLKPALARGGFKCIGATTMKEYKKYIEKDAALERRFQPVNIEPPNIDNSLLILSGLRSTYESFHDVKITNEALIAAVKYSDQYIRDRFLPDKAIDILDEACVNVKLRSVETSPILAKRQKQLDELLIKKDNYIRQQNYIMAAKMYDLEKKMRKIIKQLMQKKIKT